MYPVPNITPLRVLEVTHLLTVIVSTQMSFSEIPPELANLPLLPNFPNPTKIKNPLNLLNL